MDNILIINLLAGIFGIGLIIWLLQGQSDETTNFDSDTDNNKLLNADKKVVWKSELAAQKVKEAELAFQEAKEAELAALQAKEAELAALQAKEAELAAQQAKEAELAAQKAKEAKIGNRKAKEKARARKRREDALAAKKAAEERKKLADEKKRQQDEEKYAAWDELKYAKLKEGFEKHKSILLNNMSNALVINEYGHVEQDNRLEEWNRFLTSLGFPTESRSVRHSGKVSKALDRLYARKPKNYSKFTDPNYKFKSKLTWELEAKFAKDLLKELNVYKAARKAAGFDPDGYPESGHDFENWVSENLKRFGWTTKVTMGSGDQGVDIIASTDGKTVGIQCKRFKKPVGNKAVQEIAAGAKHYGLTYAMVISTGGYTKSAKELATSIGVLLVSHRDIPSLSKLISN